MALTKKPTKFCSENDMLTCTEKTIYSLETLYYKCSVENNLNSIKCSKTETGCLQTQKRYIENIGILFSGCIFSTYNAKN